MSARLVLDRTTVIGLAAGLVMLQVLIFSAGFLLGAADGTQALTPPSPPVPREGEVRLASFAVSAIDVREPVAVVPDTSHHVVVGAGLVPAREGVNPSPASRTELRPSPLAKAAFLAPIPSVKPVRRSSPVRTTPRLPRSAEAYAAMIRKAAERHSVPPALVEAIARVESGFNSRAVSHKGARGLMQVMPATGRRFGVRSDKLFDPEHNLNAGVAYLAWLSKRYRGNLDFIVAAYNAGEGAVDDHGGIPPYRETRDYVRRVKVALQSIEEKVRAADRQSVPGDLPQSAMGIDLENPENVEKKEKGDAR